MFRTPAIILLTCICAISAQAQDFYFQYGRTPKLLVGEKDTSFNGFFGGMRYPRASNIDLNFDGIQDLFLFDKEDRQVMTFLGNGNKKNPEFHFAPEYVEAFPNMYHWTLLADYNCDGLQDVFTGNGRAGFSVYENVSRNGRLEFKLVEYEAEYYDEQLSGNVNIPIENNDVPLVIDIDNDGDLDFLGFDDGGADVYFFANQSQDRYGHCDSLEFVAQTWCWGMFREGETNNDIKHLKVEECLLDLDRGVGHVGSNMLALDKDDDGDYDLALSDVSYGNALLLENGRLRTGQKEWRKDTIISVEKNFPQGTKAIDIDLFPAMYYLDLDFDGVKDLYVAPGPTSDAGYKITQSWVYKNKGKNSKPDFEFKQDDFIQGRGIDLGVHSYPTVFDVDADGDLDLVVAGPKPTGKAKEKYYALALYKNVGSKMYPVFEKTNDDYLGLFSRAQEHASPAFGDIDNDGDIDLLIGLANGKLMHFDNTAGQGNEASFSFQTDQFQGISVGEFLSPFIYDLDGDGKSDLLLGTDTGTVQYWKSGGQTFSLANEQLGGVFVGISRTPEYSQPGFATLSIADIDDDNKPEMVVGDVFGKIHLYDNVNPTQKTFKKIYSPFYNELRNDTFNKDIGQYASVCLADVNADGYQDLFVGNIRGGVNYFEGNRGKVGIPEFVFDQAMSVYPNPSSSVLNIEVEDQSFKGAKVSVVNSIGQTIHQLQLFSERHQIDVSPWPKGVYYFTVQHSNGSVGAKPIMVQ